MKRITSLCVTTFFVTTLFLAGCGGSSPDKQASTPAPVKPDAAPSTEKVAKSKPGSTDVAAEEEKATTITQPSSTAASAKTVVTYDQLLQAADRLIGQRDIKSALNILTAAIKAKPTRTEAYIKRAAILAEAKLIKQAIGDMNSAIAIDTENPKLRNTRGYFQLLLKDYAAAEVDFNKAIDLDNNYPQVYNNRGLVFVGQKAYVKALNDFQKAISLKPDYADALNNLGFVYLQMDDPDLQKAVATFGRVLEIDDKYMNAISNRGRANLLLENYKAALADFDRAIELQPENAQYYLHRSEAYKALGEKELAKADLDHVVWAQRLAEIDRRILNNRSNVDTWIARGEHLLVEDKFEQAEKAFSNALALEPTHLDALQQRVRLHVQKSEFDSALQLCNTALEARETTEVRSLRGDLFLALEKFDDAIADFETARRFDSRVVEAYRKRGSAYEAAGKSDLAKADLEHAEMLQSQLSDPRPLKDVTEQPRAFVPVNYEKTSGVEEEVIVE